MKKIKEIIKNCWTVDKFAVFLITMIIILLVVDIISCNILSAVVDFIFTYISIKLLLKEYNKN